MIKILAIDDLQDNLTTFKAVVREVLPDCTILTALNGLQGIELAPKRLRQLHQII